MSREAVTVEFVGTPGAGKTTLASDLVRALRCRGVVADTIVSAARPRAARTRVGAMISRLPESSLRRVLLWYVFTTASVGHAIGFACRHPALVLHVARILRFGDSYARRTRAHIWFFRLCGRLRFLTSTARPGEVLVVDDGFLHRSVHFYADPDRAPNLGAVRRYAELVPRSTLSIHVDADVTTCLARVRARGVWDHARHLDDADLRRYLTRADFVVRAATGRVRHAGPAFVTVRNDEPSVHVVVDLLEAEVRTLVAHHAEATPSHAARVHVPRIPRPSRVRAQVAAHIGRPVLAPDRIGDVLARYDLRPTAGRTRDLRLARRSLNVSVETDRGPKVVKRYRPQWSEAAVVCGHSVLVELEARRFPAVRLVRTPGGATFTRLGDDIFAVFDLEPGTSYSLNYLRRRDRLALTATAGRTLSAFHRVLDGFSPGGEHHLGFVGPHGPRRRDVEWHRDTVAQLRERSVSLGGEAAAPAAILMARSAPTLREIEQLEHALSGETLPRLVVHGDYGLHNLLFRSTSEAVVVDFENARLDWRVNDLISVLGKHRYQRDREYDLEAMEVFLRAYATTSPFTELECEALPAAWRLYRLRAAVQYWNSYFETNGPVRKLWSAVDALEQAELANGTAVALERLTTVALATAPRRDLAS